MLLQGLLALRKRTSPRGLAQCMACVAGYTEVSVIPSGARNIRVEELSSSRNFLGVGSAANNTFYLNGNGLVKPNQ